MKRNISNNIEINHKLNLTKRGFHFHVNERQEPRNALDWKLLNSRQVIIQSRGRIRWEEHLGSPSDDITTSAKTFCWMFDQQLGGKSAEYKVDWWIARNIGCGTEDLSDGPWAGGPRFSSVWIDKKFSPHLPFPLPKRKARFFFLSLVLSFTGRPQIYHLASMVNNAMGFKSIHHLIERSCCTGAGDKFAQLVRDGSLSFTKKET